MEGSLEWGRHSGVTVIHSSTGNSGEGAGLQGNGLAPLMTLWMPMAISPFLSMCFTFQTGQTIGYYYPYFTNKEITDKRLCHLLVGCFRKEPDLLVLRFHLYSMENISGPAMEGCGGVTGVKMSTVPALQEGLSEGFSSSSSSWLLTCSSCCHPYPHHTGTGQLSILLQQNFAECCIILKQDLPRLKKSGQLKSILSDPPCFDQSARNIYFLSSSSLLILICGQKTRGYLWAPKGEEKTFAHGMTGQRVDSCLELENSLLFISPSIHQFIHSSLYPSIHFWSFCHVLVKGVQQEIKARLFLPLWSS